MINKTFPLKNINLEELEKQIKQYPQSNFAFERKFDIHTGIDIYCKEGDEVLSVENGEVVELGFFTGVEANSPWWNTTQYIVIKGPSGFILYGELIIDKEIKIGDKIKQNQIMGLICPVLKKDKNKNPINMLHLEFYSKPPFALIWNKGENMPKNMINPLLIFKQP